MPQWQEDPAALGMNRIGDATPSFDLTIRIDAGRAGVAVTADRNRRRLGNDQATLRCALGIILDHQVARNVAWIGPHPRQRRHHDTVGELIGANLDWREQRAHGYLLFNDGGRWSLGIEPHHPPPGNGDGIAIALAFFSPDRTLPA